MKSQAFVIGLCIALTTLVWESANAQGRSCCVGSEAGRSESDAGGRSGDAGGSGSDVGGRSGGAADREGPRGHDVPERSGYGRETGRIKVPDQSPRTAEPPSRPEPVRTEPKETNSPPNGGFGDRNGPSDRGNAKAHQSTDAVPGGTIASKGREEWAQLAESGSKAYSELAQALESEAVEADRLGESAVADTLRSKARAAREKAAQFETIAAAHRWASTADMNPPRPSDQAVIEKVLDIAKDIVRNAEVPSPWTAVDVFLTHSETGGQGSDEIVGAGLTRREYEEYVKRSTKSEPN